MLRAVSSLLVLLLGPFAGLCLLPKTLLADEGIPVESELVIEKSGDDYRTRAELLLPDGSVERRQGTAILYAGYNWRGSSEGERLGELKEVMMLSDDGSTLSGRFYGGVHGELGLDDVTSELLY